MPTTNDTTTHRTHISFDCTRDEGRLARQIAERAVPMLGRDRTDIEMDIIAVHANGCPLRLAELLDADNFNFAHDLFGIARHLDRATGKLSNHFLPRYSKPKGAL